MNIVYCDSSFKEACVVIPNVIGAEFPCLLLYPDAPLKSPNVGEYRAVLFAMKRAHVFSLKEIRILSDSQLVVRQVNGENKCKHAHLVALRDEVRAAMKTFIQCELEWISREENLAGKVLEKRLGKTRQ